MTAAVETCTVLEQRENNVNNRLHAKESGIAMLRISLSQVVDGSKQGTKHCRHPRYRSMSTASLARHRIPLTPLTPSWKPNSPG